MTFRLRVMDSLKSLGISVILLGALGSAFLALIQYARESWWFWSWLLFAAFQLLMLWLYPGVIAPLFNRYEPIQDQVLKRAVMDQPRRAVACWCSHVSIGCSGKPVLQRAYWPLPFWLWPVLKDGQSILVNIRWYK